MRRPLEQHLEEPLMTPKIDFFNFLERSALDLKNFN